MSSCENQVPTIYKEAIRRYEKITNKKLDTPSMLKIAGVDDLIREVDQQNNQFSDFREKKHLFFKVLDGAMRPVELISNVAAGGFSIAFPPSSLVFGAATYLIKAAKGVSASYDAIQDLMKTLKDFTVRLSIHNREKISKELTDQLNEILITLIEIFALSRKIIKNGRLLQFAKNVLIGSDDKIKVAVDKFAKLIQTESLLVGLETLTETKKIGRTVDDVAVTLTSVNVTVQEIHEKMSFGHQNIVKKLLQPSVAAQDWFDKINRSRVPGTGDWIRREYLFQTWIDKGIPVLWVSGNPGSGKSYVSSNIISFLRDQYPQGVHHPSHVSVGYFFFKDDSPKTRSFHQALRDMAYQISQNDPIYAKFIEANCDSSEDISTLHSAWRTLFVNFFLKRRNADSGVYLIIDGVDEAFESEWQSFLQLAKDIKEVTVHSRIWLIMVGRPQLSDSISEALEAELPTIHVSSGKNSADIVRYIEISVQTSSVLKRLSAKLQNQIVESLSTGAQGMFIWVDLMLQELLRKRSESSIRKSLNEAPRGLKQMLRHVLESFSLTSSEDEAESLNELLAWTACAQRPLSLGELDTILKLNSSEGEGIIYLEGALRKQFASFFSLTREDGLSTAELQGVGRTSNSSDGETDSSGLDEGFETVDNVTGSDSNPTTTGVTFCHASIGDFLRNESQSKVSVGEEYPAIGVDFNEAKTSVLRTCLKLLCDDRLAKISQQNSQSMMPYASENWQAHLRAVEFSKTKIEQRKDIGGLLAKMFGQKAFMNNWAGEVGWEFFNDENVKLVRLWLDDEDTVGSLPREDQMFVSATSASPVMTFTTLAKYIAKEWLENVLWPPDICCDVVHSYISLEKGTPLEGSFVGLDIAEDIISVAEWLNLDKTALWYRRLATALSERGEYDEALNRFSKALELDSKMWLARSGISRVHILKGDYGRAIELDRISEQELQQKLFEHPESTASIKIDLHTLQERMAQSYEALKDDESNFLYYQNAHRNDRGCNNCTFITLAMMHDRGLHCEIIDLLRAMDGEETPGKKSSTLIEFFFHTIDFHLLFVATAARETNNFYFLMKAYQRAIIFARQALMTVSASCLEHFLAVVYYQYTQEQKKAVVIWSKIVQKSSGSKEESEMSRIKYRAAICLAQHFFQRALDVGTGSPDAGKYVQKLEKLTKLGANSLGTFISNSYAAVILGSWYRLSNMQEDSNAYFKPLVQRGLQLLSDNDPNNDWQGYNKLMAVLTAAHDDRNAIAVRHFCHLIDHLSMWCDGICNRRFSNFDNYECRYCHDIAFCEDCLNLLKDSSLPRNICSPKHEWLYVPPRPPMFESEKPMMLVDNLLIDMEDWKNGLRQQWQI